MYTEKVMDHFMHPRNVGEIDNASGVGTVGCGICGLFKAVFHWVKAIVVDHVKAIYGL